MPERLAYPNIEAYYRAWPAARDSVESDYGVWWRDDDGGIWRVTYVHETGHVYAILVGPRGATRRAARIGGQPVVMISAADDDHLPGPVAILGALDTWTDEQERAAGRAATEAWRTAGFRAPRPEWPQDPAGRLLDGWADICGQQGSLAWVMQRVAGASQEASHA